MLGKNSVKIKCFDFILLVLKELESGGVDVVVVDELVVKNYIVNNFNSKLCIVIDFSFFKEDYGIVVCKDDLELLVKINKGLVDMKVDGSFVVISV